ncbi:MAG TPA: lamin tail domain-containing protein, partial [Chthoniobacteraceae bacterium]|nr:lamin tail domain-containing protein [Chthoniobacteraceae bacterium]
TQGFPRDDPFYGYYQANPAAFPQYNPANYPAASAPHWNGTVPGIFVKDGVVYDVQTRYHGSRYQRSAAKNSWKFVFPSSRLLDGVKQRILVTEKGSENVLGYALFHAAGLPAAYSQFVDFFKNTDATGLIRCEISDNDEEMIKRFQTEEIAREPQTPPAFTGDGVIYKSKGLDGNEGPYGWANGQKMPAVSVWTQLDRYIWSFPIQNSDWRGHTPFRNMVDALWAARGDAVRVTYPNTYNGDPTSYVNQDALRVYMDANWDKEKLLSYLAIRNWMSPWDDKFHNHHVYLQGDGKWTMIPWDFDGELQGTDANTAAPTNSIFAGKKDDLNGSYSNNSRGPNWWKDSAFRAYEDNVGPNTNNDYRKKLFILNNTLLKPQNVTAFAASMGITVPSASWLTARFASVNTQVALGTWYAPDKPVNTGPSNNASVLPGVSLTTSAYSHSNPTPVAHARTRWEIRAADGTYAAPIYNVVSAGNLTTLPIPFGLLTFGKAYAWRATFYDADDHPSEVSNESTFLFGLAPTTGPLVSIGPDAPWRYNQTATFDYPSPVPAANDPTWWASTAYNDSTWSSGDPLFGGTTSTPLPANVRTTLSIGRTTYYFRKTFHFPGSPSGATIRATRWIDDGCVVYINGVEVPELRRAMGTGAPLYSTLASGNAVGTAAQEGPIDVPAKYFVQGTNTVAVEVHQVTTGSSDIAFALGLDADIPRASGDVVINEALADNQSAVSNGGANPDYLELFNATGSNVSLNGWSLTDDVLVPGKYNFPAGTTIPAGGYLVVYCDNDLAAPGLHAGFKLAAGGQTVALIQGTAVKDFVTFGPQAPNLAIGRVGAGVGAWGLITPSPGAANAARTLGSSTTLRLNEWMANPSSGEDWFEIYNPDASPVALAGLYLSDTASTLKLTQIPVLSFVAGKGFARFEADGLNEGANHADFKLGASGDALFITATNGTTPIDSVSFGAQTLNVSSGRLPDGAATTVAFAQSPTPGESNFLPAAVVISEALTNSSAPLEDAIELHNPTAAAINLGGWWLSDDESTLQKYQLSADTNIAAGGYLVLQESQFGPGVNGFALSSTGEKIVLSAVNGSGALTGYRAVVSFGAAADGFSYGRILTGNPAGSHLPEFWPLMGRTFGQANSPPKTGPVIINEVMYHPPDLANSTDNARDEFIELHNITTSAQSIAGWKLKGDSDFAFPSGAVLQPGDYALVVSFDPVVDTVSRDAFRSEFGVSARTTLFGPYSPRIPNDTQRLELAFPGTLVDGLIPFILVDKVESSDATPWPAAADGSGPSLQRGSRTAIGNDPANWNAAAPTPGGVNNLQSPILDNDGDGVPNTWEEANGMNQFSATDALIDGDGDGQHNLAEYIAGSDPRDANDSFKVDIAPAADGTGFSLRFTAAANRTYSILYKDALTDPQWQKLTDIVAQPTAYLVERTDTTARSQRFYRIVTPQQ